MLMDETTASEPIPIDQDRYRRATTKAGFPAETRSRCDQKNGLKINTLSAFSTFHSTGEIHAASTSKTFLVQTPRTNRHCKGTRQRGSLCCC